MKNIISDTDLETASLEALWGISTATMKEEAEEVATAEMARISQPICGAREIVIAGHLRKRLAGERAWRARWMSSFCKS